jgi:hypothetical protein
MTGPLVLAPQRAGLPRAPYLTADEYLAVPTGIDIENLIEGANEDAQLDALALAIEDGSSVMDNYVHYVLGATVDTENARVRVNREGRVRVVCRAIPILEVRSFSYGLTPSLMTAVDQTSAQDAWIEDNILEMPVFGSSTTVQPRLAPGIGFGDRLYCLWTYVNGYANALLATAVTGGATVFTPRDTTGIYGGMQLTVYDVGAKEAITVDPSYVPGATPIPLLAGTTFANSHAGGVAVSAMPAAVKRAAVHATTAMLKGAPGSSALVAESAEGEPKATGRDADGWLEDIAKMEYELRRFVLPVLG